ncbi:phytanoyl-CoA dioxygenase family protein [Nocardia jiangxiensis]|uniref:Phytanoyl-CoA dioxygenase family protein n=1 Tax=Nocardia jiangxiensis TaxID=282685 RepID=A0ABW6RYM1_9NOCA
MSEFVRTVSPEETAFFVEHGWVRLPNLVDEREIGQLRERAEARLAARLSDEAESTGFVDQAFGQARDIADVDVRFRRLAHDPTMAANVVTLLGTVEKVRLQITNLLVKQPKGQGRHDGATVFHQDFPWMPMDRSGMLTVWVALAPVAPEMGPLRFYDRSHERGLLGRSFVRPNDDMPTQHPWLADLPITEGAAMAPGDATVHHCLTVHGAGENTGDAVRLSFAATYFDAATLYTGAPYGQTDQLDLGVNGPFDHPRFPTMSTVR